MGKANLRNKFVDKMKEIEVQYTKDKEEVFSIDTSDIDFSFCNLSNGEDNDKLKKLSVQFFSLRAKSTIHMGQIFNEAFEILTEEGNYQKWLLGIGVDKKTALRYRKRATLYSLANEKDKALIATISQKLIDKIFDDRTLLENLTNLKNDVEKIEDSKQEAAVIEAELVEEELEKEIEDTFHSVINNIDSLEKSKQVKIHNLMKKIQNIINS